ncbi:tyrosine-type recombinase/integrase [Caulobacter sp. UC70_42]|uniref:tyrosine-type recombinase/integrase n=1 Tax=Caulobacter sp. UC70_42 TaxID=3374551 RepID=UPI0037570101
MTLKRLAEPGLYPDGGGLHLQVTGAGGRSWVFRYWVSGRERRMGLGPLHMVSLAEARDAAERARRLRFQGVDPLEARRGKQAGNLPEFHSPAPSIPEAVQLVPERAVTALTFAAAVDAYIKGNRAGWRNEKHAKQWTSTLTTYAFPYMGALALDEIETKQVLAALQPIWIEKSETASRVRGRIEAVLDWATVQGHRSGENPARWKGHLEMILPAKSKVAPVTHHPALPYAEMPAFMKRLAGVNGIAARALEFTILTAARTGEVIGAESGEIDLKSGLWTIPAGRMKGQKEHRVPLSSQAVAILNGAKERAVDRGAAVLWGQFSRHAGRAGVEQYELTKGAQDFEPA